MKSYTITVEKFVKVFGEVWYHSTVAKTNKMSLDKVAAAAKRMTEKFADKHDAEYRVYCNEVNGWNEVIKKRRIA